MLLNQKFYPHPQPTNHIINYIVALQLYAHFQFKHISVEISPCTEASDSVNSLKQIIHFQFLSPFGVAPPIFGRRRRLCFNVYLRETTHRYTTWRQGSIWSSSTILFEIQTRRIGRSKFVSFMELASAPKANICTE